MTMLMIMMIMSILMIDFDKIINLRDSVDVEVITNVLTSLNVMRSKIPFWVTKHLTAR